MRPNFYFSNKLILACFIFLCPSFHAPAQLGGDLIFLTKVQPTSFIINNNNSLRSTDAVLIGDYLLVSFSYKSSTVPKGSLNVYNVSNPASPALVKEVTFTDRWFDKMLLENNILYVVGKGLTVFDVTNPSNPTSLAYHTKTTGSQAYDINSDEIDKQGEYLFFDRSAFGVMSVRMSSPTSTPVFLSTRTMVGSGYNGIVFPSASSAVSFDDYDAYHSNLNNGVLTSDGNSSIPGFPVDVSYDSNRKIAFVSSEPGIGGQSGLVAFDVVNKVISGQLLLSTRPGRILYLNNIVFIQNNFNNGFIAVNVSNLGNMTLIKSYPVPANSSNSGTGCFRYFETAGLMVVGDARRFDIYKSGVVAPIPAPTITSFTPISGAVLSAVTITGTNFSIIPTNNIVTFNGTIATVTASTATSLTTTVPAAATSGVIRVSVGSLTAASSNSFTVNISALAPTITSFTPVSGSAGTSVTIIGTNFSSTPSNNIVRFNGTVANVTASTPTSITTSVPTGSTSGAITVSIGSQIATSTSSFTATSPTITLFAPLSGPAGTAVTITGTNFNATPANNIVTFNGTIATVTASTATSLTATVPAAATSGVIRVSVGSLTAASSNSFTVNISGLAPTITSFTPVSGSAGTSVTIIGTNFSSTFLSNIIKFNGVEAVVSASTPNSITTIVPAIATTGLISVTVSSQTATSSVNFTVTCTKPAKPIITASALNTETPVLTSSAAAGNQWFLNGNPIAGATSSILTVNILGVYSVRVTVPEGCVSDPSDNFVIVITGDLDDLGSNGFYPNPAERSIIFESAENGLKSLQIFQNNGQTLDLFNFEGFNLEVSLENYSPGIYYFNLKTENGNTIGKFLKKN